MRASIVENNCIGCGLCKRLYAEVFDIKDKCAYIIKDSIEEKEIKNIKDAAFQCPMSAIKIYE